MFIIIAMIVNLIVPTLKDNLPAQASIIYRCVETIQCAFRFLRWLTNLVTEVKKSL